MDEEVLSSRLPTSALQHGMMESRKRRQSRQRVAIDLSVNTPIEETIRCGKCERLMDSSRDALVESLVCERCSQTYDLCEDCYDCMLFRRCDYSGCRAIVCDACDIASTTYNQNTHPFHLCANPWNARPHAFCETHRDGSQCRICSSIVLCRGCGEIVLPGSSSFSFVCAGKAHLFESTQKSTTYCSKCAPTHISECGSRKCNVRMCHSCAGATPHTGHDPLQICAHGYPGVCSQSWMCVAHASHDPCCTIQSIGGRVCEKCAFQCRKVVEDLHHNSVQDMPPNNERKRSLRSIKVSVRHGQQ